jgi:outer membrane receptor protein involved in Fe transport
VAIDIFDPNRVIELHRQIDLDVSSDKWGVYGAYRRQLLPAVTLELGGRWDHYSYDDGLAFTRVSPRVNLVYDVAGGTLRAAWGVIHQPQGVEQVQVEDGVTDFFEPERVDYVALGYSHPLWNGVDMRFDVYRKNYSDLRPRFENQLDSIRLIPEAESDRIRIDATRARAQGIELSLRRSTFEQWGGWFGYGYSQAEDEEDDVWVPRSWHQRHTVSFGLGRASAKWAMNLTGLYHTGAPTTEVMLVPVQRADGTMTNSLALGARNEDRLDDYLRFDLRVSRTSILASGVLTYYLEVFNLLDRMNPCCVDHIDADSRNASVEYSGWFPRLPSFGFQFEF